MTDDIDHIRQRLEHIKQRIVNHVNAADAEANAIKDMMAGPLPKLSPQAQVQKQRRWPRFIGESK